MRQKHEKNIILICIHLDVHISAMLAAAASDFFCFACTVIVILYCRRPSIVIAAQSVAATMAGSNAVGLAVVNASLQASVLQQYVRVFQTSANRCTENVMLQPGRKKM